jgi:hypothetical protein
MFIEREWIRNHNNVILPFPLFFCWQKYIALLGERSKIMRKLKFIGIDGWSRPVYKDQNGKLWKDVNLGIGTPDMHNASSNDFEGEPDFPITDDYEIIKKMEE